jgi:conjugative transposon TraN protein
MGLIIGSFFLPSQVKAQPWQIKEIKPINITVSDGVTSSLIFPFEVVSADRGLATLLVQKPKGMNNVLHLKAANEKMNTTSLSVITSDGNLYPFIVSYAPQPSILNLRISVGNSIPNSQNGPVSFSEHNNKEAEIRHTAERIAAEKNMCNIQSRAFGMTLAVKGVYVKSDVIYFKIALKNSTAITFDAEFFRFGILDNKRGNKTSTQEITLKPLNAFGNYKQIKKDSINTVVFALPKFSVPSQKHLVIEMIESGGARNPRVIINNRRLVKAKVL